jgi:RsmE family RNA methyltransferase
MNIVLFTPDEIRRPLSLTDERTQHILGVLKKAPGDTFEAGIVGGAAGTAAITGIDGALRFAFTPSTNGIPANPLTMLIGFPRPIQLKRMFRDLAGLGVRAIHLCGTDLGEKSYLDSTVIARGAAQKLLTDGASQAKSTHVPPLMVHPTLDAALAAGAVIASVRTVCLAPDPAGAASLRASLAGISGEELRGRGVCCAIGAERGWTDRERVLLKDAGFICCSLGKRILRTETAATAAAALILGALDAL